MFDFKPLKQSVSLKTADSLIHWGDLNQWVLFGGPDIMEDEAMVLEVAQELKKICSENNVSYILKCSYDKANRQSLNSYRGPGAKKALEALGRIKAKVGVPLLSDVHDISQISMAAEIVDVLQIPAFLCRQTDLVVEAAKTNKVLHIKKGQFMAPEDMQSIANKALASGNNKILFCERGTSFGYHRLINDFSGLAIMRSFGFPVIMDITHSTQLPGAGSAGTSGGLRDFSPLLARAAMAVGVDGIFCETHPDPDSALCDGPTSVFLKDMPKLVKSISSIWDLHKK